MGNEISLIDLAFILIGLGAAFVVWAALLALGATIAAATLYAGAVVARWVLDFLLEMASTAFDLIADKVSEWRGR